MLPLPGGKGLQRFRRLYQIIPLVIVFLCEALYCHFRRLLLMTASAPVGSLF